MLALVKIFFISFGVALSGAMMPGPLLTVAISESSRKGFIAGPLLIAGHAILELALVIALVFGLAPFFESDKTFAFIAFAGAGILLWMAVGMFRSLPKLSLSLETKKDVGGNLVLRGVLMSLANPYWIIWWATFGIVLIVSSQKLGVAGIASFFAGHILADLAWYSIVTATVAMGRHLLSDRLYRGIIAFLASFLVAVALYFVYDASMRVFF